MGKYIFWIRYTLAMPFATLAVLLALSVVGLFFLVRWITGAKHG